MRYEIFQEPILYYPLYGHHNLKSQKERGKEREYEMVEGLVELLADID